MTPDKVFATLPVHTPADSMFEPISNEEMVTAQFHDTFCVDIRRRLSEGVALPLGDIENEILCRQVTKDQIVIFHAL